MYNRLMKIRTIPAGITWTKTGRRTWRCTIRREPETVVEYGLDDFAALNAANLREMQLGMHHTNHTGDLGFGGAIGNAMAPIFGFLGIG